MPNFKRETEIFDINEKLLKWSGFWPINENLSGTSKIIKRIKTGLFLCVCFTLILYPQYLFIRTNWENLAEVSVCISMLLSNILQVLKMLVYICYRETLSDVVIEMRAHWRENKLLAHSYWESTRIRNERANRKIALAFFIPWISAATFVFFKEFVRALLTCLITGTKLDDSMIKYPIPELYPFDYKGIDVYKKIIIYLIATSSIWTIVMLVAAMDATILSFINYGASFFEFVSSRLLHLKNFKNNTKDDVADLDHEVVSILKSHALAIRFTNLMEKAFNFIMLAQYFITTLLLCICGFSLTLLLKNPNLLSDMIPYTILMYVQVYTISISGSKLMKESFNVATSAYSVDWYNKPKSVRLALLLIILRSQKPIGISAAKFYKINLQTFANILSTSLSYFMLLRKLIMNE